MDTAILFKSALRTQGHKVTKNRTAILEYLSNHDKPVSAEEIFDYIKAEYQDVHKTTIYRELFFLLEKNFIHEVEFGDGKKRYELALNRAHHHHIVCINCKKVEDIPLDNEFSLQEKLIEKATNFHLTSHMLEFFGLCPDCK